MTIPNEPVKLAMTPIHDRPLKNNFQNDTYDMDQVLLLNQPGTQNLHRIRNECSKSYLRSEHH